jgi:flagellar assembly factor FliW
MHIHSVLFGPFEVDEDKLIEFPAGLPGFESSTRYTLVREEGATHGVLQLQSVDDPALAFALADSRDLGVNYEFELSDPEVAALALTDPLDAWVGVIVRRDEIGGGTPANAGLRANFMAPLVINLAARRGLQKIISRLGCDITLRAT